MKLLFCKSKRLLVSAFALAFLVCAAFGQQQSSEPQARKFAEIPLDADAESSSFYFDHDYSARLDDERRKNYESNLVEYLKRVRLEKAESYIIGYSPRVAPSRYDSTVGKRLAEQIKSRLSSLQYRLSVANYDSEIFKTIDGGFRERAAVELWIVPPGAKPPIPTPTVDAANVIYCPQIPNHLIEFVVMNPASSVEFEMNLKYGGEESVTPVYRWATIGGEIIDGQGTAIIKVKPTINSGTIRAKVEIQGFSPECPCGTTTAAMQANYNVSQYKFDEFGRAANGDMKARLDNLKFNLDKEPDLRAYIISYAGRLNPTGATQRNGFMSNYLVKTRGTSLERIEFIEGGYREEISTEFWLGKPAAGAPPLMPTIDPKFIVRKLARRK